MAANKPADRSRRHAPTGLVATLEHLVKSENTAALATLIAALDAPCPRVQPAALAALLRRRHPAGQREVLRRLHRAGADWRAIIDAQPGRLTDAVRDGLLDPDEQVCENACRAMLWFREFDLAGVLLTALETPDHPRAALLAETLLAVVDELLADCWASPRDRGRRDPQLIRHRVAGSLEASVRRFAQHGRHEVVRAFLPLADRENVTLKQILQDPHHGTFATLVGALARDERPAVLQLIVSFLDDPHAPSAALSLVARRSDARFLAALLRKCGHPLSNVAVQNLKRIDHLAALAIDAPSLDALEEPQQAAAVPLVLATNLPRGEVFRMVEHLLAHGKLAGRVAAAKALAQFDDEQAAPLVLQALEDSEPRVQAAMLPQIRQRGTPGALRRLVDLVESPHDCVRSAAREALAEFTFERYLTAFDLLEEDARRSTGQLVRRVDPRSTAMLIGELKTQSRGRRLRALAMAECMGAVARLEPELLALMHDEDHLVRSEAARALAGCSTPAVHEALQEALHDRAVSVQDAAARSLAALAGKNANHTVEARQA